jgi:predicted RNase H-like nuclease (RuvC/YqgF family)
LEDDPKILKSILQAKESEIANLKRELEQYRQSLPGNGSVPIETERLKHELKEHQENNEKLKTQISDLKLRESALVIRLSQKEQEIIELTASFTLFQTISVFCCSQKKKFHFH